MSRLIDADALKESYCKSCVIYLHNCDGQRISCYPNSVVNEQPTIDAVHVVRCKDCKWFDEQEVCNKNFMVIMDPNFFCADGEVATVKDGENKDSGDVKC